MDLLQPTHVAIAVLRARALRVLHAGPGRPPSPGSDSPPATSRFGNAPPEPQR